MSIEVQHTCPHCGQENNRLRESTDLDCTPNDGDPSICFGCGGIAVLDSRLGPRFPTEAEAIEFSRETMLMLQIASVVLSIAVNKGNTKIQEN